MKRPGGFTLVEMLIVVAIIGILAGIAFPTYRSYVLRANRTLAKTAMTEVVSRQESWYVDHKAYSTGLSRLGYAADLVYLSRDGSLSAAGTADAVYKLSLAGNPNSTTCPPGGTAARTGYTLLAEPQNGQAADNCRTLCLSSAGAKAASGTTTGCWTR